MNRMSVLALCAWLVPACAVTPEQPAPDAANADAVVTPDSATPAPDSASPTPDAVTPAPDATAPASVRLRVRVANIAPWTLLKSGAMAVQTSGSSGALGPGQAFEVSFTAGRNQRVSFAAMLGESNDWFFAPGPDGIALYQADGLTPVTGDVTAQVSLWNAGTEVDEEPAVGANTGPRQSAPDQGPPDPDATVREIRGAVTLSAGGTFTPPPVASMVRVTLTPRADRVFVLRIENVSTATTLVTSQGARAVHVSPVVWALHGGAAPLFTPGMRDRGQGLELLAESGRTAVLASALGELTGFGTPVSPGVYVVHHGGQPIYSLGTADRGQGLERIAESGNPAPLAAALMAMPPSTARVTDVFNTPLGATSAGAATPGNAYEFELDARPGDRLSFATMFGMSNDWFFATPPDGIALFDADGTPLARDVTDLIALYDAGTEVDQELAIGPDVGPQQLMPDQGAADPIARVRVVTPVEYARPAAAHLRVTISPATTSR